MTGRFEHKIAIEEKTEKQLERTPVWLREYYYSMANNTAATKRKYINDILLFLNYLIDSQRETMEELDLNSISASTINQYFTVRKKQVVNGKALGESAIATQISILTSFFKFLQTNEYIRENPMNKAIDRPNVPYKNEVSYLTERELFVIMNNLKNGVGSQKAKSTQKRYQKRDKLIFLIPLATGCRVSALDEINISDIDFINCTIKIVDKGNKHFVQGIPEKLLTMIEDWCEERKLIPGANQTDALFVSKRNGECQRLSVSAMQKIVDKFSEGVDRKISPHELRRTFGTNVYRQTGDILLTSQLLGHSSPTTTKRYASVDKKKAEEVKDRIIKELL